MNEIALPSKVDLNPLADNALKFAARFWFLVTATGLWIFAYYVASLYVASVLRGDIDAWNQVLPRGYVAGDTLGNLALGLHMFLAVAIIAGGPLQLITRIRSRFPAFHHWNGRLFLLGSCMASIAGLYLVWIRGGTVGDLTQHLGITLDALLILICAAFAVRFAMARKIAEHQRWALRLFMVVNAVWFFRIGLMFWLFVHQGPVGFDPQTFQGPFLSFLAFAQTLLPLAILELYLRARDSGSASARLTMAVLLSALTLAMAVGIFAATVGLWLPRI